MNLDAVDSGLTFSGKSMKNMPVSIEVRSYEWNPRVLSVRMIPASGPAKAITMNLGDRFGRFNDYVIPEYCSFLNANDPDFAQMASWLQSKGIAEPVGINGVPVTKAYDRNSTPACLYRFNPDVLKKLDPEGCYMYQRERTMADFKHLVMSDEEYENIYRRIAKGDPSDPFVILSRQAQEANARSWGSSGGPDNSGSGPKKKRPSSSGQQRGSEFDFEDTNGNGDSFHFW